jgi:hypothetical protein
MDEGGVVEMDAAHDADMHKPDVDEMEPDAELDSGLDASDPLLDATIEAGADADAAEPTWPYVPSNVDVEDGVLSALDREDIALDCATTAIINSSDPPSASGFCAAVPELVVIEQQNGGGDVLVVVMSSLSIEATSTLKLVGSRPIVLLVEGDVSVAGLIDASADGAVSGPGGNLSCAGSTGTTGNDAPTTNNGAYGASGGGGGGFGSAGTASGPSGSTSAVAGGAVSGDGTLVPLRGGCSGGRGGFGDGPAPMPMMHPHGGGGGGALQLSVAGAFELTGVINAGGGGGAAGRNIQGGGGGGGSGGAVLIEAEMLLIDDAAVIAVNGGAGGGGQPTSGMLSSTAGGDGLASTMNAMPGFGSGTASDGGRGAAIGGAPTTGGVPMFTGSGCPTTLLCLWGGGGGGGGGVGRIQVRGARACALPGIYSPAPAIDCESCGACPSPPDFTCSMRAFETSVYSLCPSQVAHSAARTQCQSAGQELLKIDDPDENAFLASLINSDVWLGASDVVEGDWRWLVDNTQLWSGDEEGAAVGAAFTSWVADEEPNGTGDCARLMPDGDWEDEDCLDTLPFVCEHTQP